MNNFKIFVHDKVTYLYLDICSLFSSKKIAIYKNNFNFENFNFENFNDNDLFIIKLYKENYLKVLRYIKSYTKKNIILISSDINLYFKFSSLKNIIMLYEYEENFKNYLKSYVQLYFNKLKFNKLKINLDGFIYKSKEIRFVIKNINKNINNSFIIFGESGVGKTPISFLANYNKDKIKPFYRINCAGLSKDQFYSTLFGHVKGAYTGAISDRKGIIEYVKNDGNIILDEISSLSKESQGLLLNFMDTGYYRKMGGSKLRYSNSNIIGLTNTNLEKLVKKNMFRADLFYRFQDYIFVPPLRKRKIDIIPILKYYFFKLSKSAFINNKVLDFAYNNKWENGNVREIINFAKLYPKIIRKRYYQFSKLNYYEKLEKNISKTGIKTFFNKIDENLMKYLITKYKSIKEISKILKISSPAVIKKLKKYNINL